MDWLNQSGAATDTVKCSLFAAEANLGGDKSLRRAATIRGSAHIVHRSLLSGCDKSDASEGGIRGREKGGGGALKTEEA